MFDFDLLNLSAPDVIEKFREKIQEYAGGVVKTFSVSHVNGSNTISIKAVLESGRIYTDEIKGGMMSFLIRKGLKMKLKTKADFIRVELVYAPEQSHIIMHTSEGIETKKL